MSSRFQKSIIATIVYTQLFSFAYIQKALNSDYERFLQFKRTAWKVNLHKEEIILRLMRTISYICSVLSMWIATIISNWQATKRPAYYPRTSFVSCTITEHFGQIEDSCIVVFDTKKQGTTSIRILHLRLCCQVWVGQCAMAESFYLTGLKRYSVKHSKLNTVMQNVRELQHNTTRFALYAYQSSDDEHIQLQTPTWSQQIH